MDKMNDNPDLDFAPAADPESPFADTGNSVAGSAATDFPALNEVNLLAKWFFIRKVASDPKLSRSALACAIHLVDLYNKLHGRAWPSYPQAVNSKVSAVDRVVGRDRR